MVHGHEPDPRTRGREGAEGARVPWLLHQHALAWTDEKAGDHRQRLLDSGDDDDLLGDAVDPA